MSIRNLLMSMLLVAGEVSLTRAQGDAGVFVEVPQPSTDAAAADGTILRRRWVAINYDQVRNTLPPPFGAAAAGQSLALNLFADTRLVAVLDRVEPTTGGYVWVGHLPEVPLSAVSLAVRDGIMVGSVTTPDATYTIRSRLGRRGGDCERVQRCRAELGRRQAGRASRPRRESDSNCRSPAASVVEGSVGRSALALL